jgi:hypothetical protein
MKLNLKNNSKIILTDIDGVCLDWEYAFDVYLQTHGFTKVDGGELKYDIGKRYGIDSDQGRKLIKIFNESAAIGFLPPLRDAMYYIKRLHEEHGYVFHAITSLSKDVNAQELRTMNLKKLFGKTAFERFVYLDLVPTKMLCWPNTKTADFGGLKIKLTTAKPALMPDLCHC